MKKSEEKTKKERKFLPGLSELLDRMSIVTLKSTFIVENRDAYEQEIRDIMHDIDLIIDDEKIKVNADTIRAIVVLSQMNLHIWMHESNIRKGIKEGNDLSLTHSLNGVRNIAKNMINKSVNNGRLDFKIDCFANSPAENYVPSDWK